MKRLIPVLLLLAGCGTTLVGRSSTAVAQAPSSDEDTQGPVVISYPKEFPDLKIYVDEYIAQFKDLPDFVEGAVKAVEIVDGFDDAGPHTVGRCSIATEPNGKPVRNTGTIEILRSFWESADEWAKRSLIIHESHHGFSGVGHLEGRLHIMNAVLPEAIVLRDHWKHFVEDLRATTRSQSKIGSAPPSKKN